jgi:AcrR family transcriptional regulator
MELLWGGRPQARRGPKPTLTTEAIANAAMELADREGLGAVTMQRLAEALAVTKMALYRYVPGKDELVALMTDMAMGPAPDLGRAEGGWRPKLAEWAGCVFARFRQHPWTVEASVGDRAVGPNELDWIEQAVAALSGAGLNGGEMLDVAMTLAGHARTLAQQEAGAAGDRPEAAMDAVMTALVSGREQRYPALTAALASALSNEAQDNAFAFGRDRILDGVEMLIAARGGVSR